MHWDDGFGVPEAAALLNWVGDKRWLQIMLLSCSVMLKYQSCA